MLQRVNEAFLCQSTPYYGESSGPSDLPYLLSLIELKF